MQPRISDGEECGIWHLGCRRLQAMIRIHSVDRAAPVMLDFGGAFGDRDAIRDVLNRKLTPAGAASSASATPPVSTVPVATGSPQVADWSSLSTDERKWRQLLMKRKEVIDLHRNLVASRIVDDEKFWKGMKCKFKQNGQRGSATAAEIEGPSDVGISQGVPSAALVSVVDASSDGGEIAWGGDTPSSAQRHRIFMEHPAVSLAYRAKVLDAASGARMTESSFWGVYKRSSMAQRHMKGAKRAAAVATEADAMFAEFTAKEDIELEAAEQKRAKKVDSSLNIDRFDDHRQLHVQDARADALLRLLKPKRGRSSAPGESRGLDLMRKLNTHGSMVLDGVAQQSSSAWREDEDARAHPLRHLEGTPIPEYTKLALRDERAFLEAQTCGPPASGNKVDIDNSKRCVGQQELEEATLHMSQQLKGWDPDLSTFADGDGRNGGILNALLAKMRP